MKKKSALASRLIAWRQAKGLSQSGAAAELRIKIDTLQNWEIDRKSPLLKTVEPVLARLEKDGF
jgi:transcriptional regulator with XRE-family HTH domain